MRSPLVPCLAAALLACGPDVDGTPTANWTSPLTTVNAPHDVACPSRSQVVIWDVRSDQPLAAALAAHADPCTDYYLTVPPDIGAGGEKLEPRGPAEPARIRALGPNFHAVAEFHWGSWHKWVASTGQSWEEAGREFRRRMADEGYDVAAGDSWEVNEFPSTVRTGEQDARAHAMAAVKGLHEGAPEAKGIVFMIGMGDGASDLGPYRDAWERLLLDGSFWTAMRAHVKIWAQEAYANPAEVCVGGDDVGERSHLLNLFAEHPASLAEAGPAQAREARRFFAGAYLPVLSASWDRSPAAGLGDTLISPLQMARFVRLEVYADGAWGESHPTPGHRLGFAWGPLDDGGQAQKSFDSGTDEVATALAEALQRSHGAREPKLACGAGGDYGGCACALKGAAADGAWASFANW